MVGLIMISFICPWTNRTGVVYAHASPECRSIKEHYRPIIIFNSTTELLLTLDTSTHYRPISRETEPIEELQFESRVKPTLQVVN